MTTLAAGHMGLSRNPDHSEKLRIYGELGVDRSRVLFVNQQHTRRVVDAGALRASGERLPEADGIVTSAGSDVPGVTAADCMPVFLKDEKTGVRALLHSGWKGTGIALEALQMMVGGYGCRKEDIYAVLGPSIGSCCYEVDEGRAAGLRRSLGG